MPELLEVNRLTVLTLLILCPIPSPFVTSLFPLQLLSQSTDKTAWIPSMLQDLDVGNAEEEPSIVFLSLSWLCSSLS